MISRPFVILVLLAACAVMAADFVDDRADELVKEGSYAKAYELYLQRFEAEPSREVELRMHDARWRALAGSRQPDSSELDAARKGLETLAAGDDEIAIRAHESLGDFYWTRRDARNWGAAWTHYRVALEHWAGSRDIERARERYLAIVRRAAEPPHAEPWYVYGSWGNQLPPEVLRNLLKIAERPDDIARAHYLLAMSLRHSGGLGTNARIERHFTAAIGAGRSNAWYDDALYHFAEWKARTGRVVRVAPSDGGGLRAEPDYAGALELLRRLVREFPEGETRYRDDARRLIEQITTADVRLTVSNVFRPGEATVADLHCRNVDDVELTLSRVSLVDDVRFTRDRPDDRSWLDALTPSTDPVRRWTQRCNVDAEHAPGHETIELGTLDTAGTYLLEARSGTKSARELVLVTQASVVMKTTGDTALVWVVDTLDGRPRPDAAVTLWTRTRANGGWLWKRSETRTDPDGVASIELEQASSGRAIWAAARDVRGHEAFAEGSSHGGRAGSEGWKLYVFTDRPAYRPGDRPQWKVVARRETDGRYTTPGGDMLRYRIVDARGTESSTGELTLNEFGSAWDELVLGSSDPLGEYRIEFRDANNRSIGSAMLLRLEEYKLPEFKVAVAPGTGPRRFGDTVEATIDAEYYFGGPVAGARVELVVRERPLWIRLDPPHEFPWLHGDAQPQHRRWPGAMREIHRETTTTDAAGHAVVRFDTPPDSVADVEYTIEARVTDASRREVVGSGSVRVARQMHFAAVRVPHRLYRPGDEVVATIRTIDADELPFDAEGRVTVTLATTDGVTTEEILARVVRTGDDGETEIAFRPSDAGYYTIMWSADERALWPVSAQTSVCVADRNTVQLGYRPGGVQILIDRDTVRAGAKTPLMLVAPVEGMHLWFTVETGDLLEQRVVRVDGTVKLIELDVDDRFVPNVFAGCVAVRDGELLRDTKEIVVPPVERFLDVRIEPDSDDYRPGADGTLTITVLDHAGRPAEAEVAVSLIDASVAAIQTDYAGDPRPFFYGAKRHHGVRTTSSFNWRRYAREDELTGTSKKVGPNPPPAPMAKMAGMAAMESRGRSMAPQEGAAAFDMADSDAGGRQEEAPSGGGDAVQVRSDFRATALWEPGVRTGADGRASVAFTMPETLTEWTATARATTTATVVGQGGAAARTNKPLVVRLQTPRFLVVGDQATLSAVLNNATEDELTVDVRLTADGLELADGDATRVVGVPAGGEARVDWTVDAGTPGAAALRVEARGGSHSDGMVLDLPVYEHGIVKLLASSGKARDGSARVRIDLPRERRAGSTELTVQVAPSLAATMLDALPYLIDYPYGCVEQTMSRFLPAAIVAGTLERLGLEPQDVATRIFGGIEREHVGSTHAKGARDLERLDAMVSDGMKRLADMQHGDGGWGWWKNGSSDRFMTAYVVWGLGLAGEADMRVDDGMLRRAATWLTNGLIEEEQRPDMQAWMLHAIVRLDPKLRAGTTLERAAFERLWERRDALNAYTRSLLAIAAQRLGETDRARVLVRNLDNGVLRDRAAGTAHWGRDGIRYRWSDSSVEATSFALMAMLEIDPGNELVDPVVTWLVRNRRGAQWSNTRDTAITIMALGDYLERSGELDAELDYTVEVNGRRIAERSIRRGDALAAPVRHRVPANALRNGSNDVRIVRTGGDGPLYYSVEARFFSLEEPVTPAGNEVFVERHYFKLVPQPTLLNGFRIEKQPLLDGESIGSGERIEVVLSVEAKNDLEYLVFEDLKPAGFEAVQLKSGEPLYATGPGNTTRRLHQELRDRKVALFADALGEGRWEMRYEMRAEATGRFHALPVVAHAMYVPEIRGNSAEHRVTVTERTSAATTIGTAGR